MVQGELLHQCGARVPPYGTKIDLQLVDTVNSYNYHAVPMTNMILRIQLIALLVMQKRSDILDAIADSDESLSSFKKYRFSDQWALRFFKRHILRSPVATTKMREEVPAKYEEKLEAFKLILCLNVRDHNVPDALFNRRYG